MLEVENQERSVPWELFLNYQLISSKPGSWPRWTGEFFSPLRNFSMLHKPFQSLEKDGKRPDHFTESQNPEINLTKVAAEGGRKL